ncbi:OVARIAN TUMOR DOMAIN-containing deubiquitinating enzyme 3 isoform X3 [Euphorbia lathyris]|uniref:OVARIAN TUMOR DOMAIN-containing deubiquitinating enzyme 3 isoform X3 n=1 Tax=Euphorbia lathyris TaxID=212925 RepID=UPI00331322A7
MAEKPANENILDQLKNGIARFELVSSPVPSISASESRICPMPFFAASSHSFFARIGPPLGGGSPAMKKVEHYSVQRITGDGRCLFRALVKGMSFNKGISLNPSEERIDADDLRMAVKETICDGNKERKQYEEALIAITVDESLKRYCQRIARPDFWGGESELLVLSKLCKQPIIVYIPEHEDRYSSITFGLSTSFQNCFKKIQLPELLFQIVRPISWHSVIIRYTWLELDSCFCCMLRDDSIAENLSYGD